MSSYSPSVESDDGNLSYGATEPYWCSFKAKVIVKVEVSIRYMRKLNFYRPIQHNKNTRVDSVIISKILTAKHFRLLINFTSRTPRFG